MASSLAIIGATSAIAQEVARMHAARGASLFLTARSEEKCAILRADLESRGAARVDTSVYDAQTDFESRDIIREIASVQPECCTILIAHGVLSDNALCADDEHRAIRDFTLNATSVIAICTQAARWYASHAYPVKPCIAVISSVAGDRGRGSNHYYGAAKGAVTIFLQGLRNRLFKSGINVVTIKPGFVDTPMTAHVPKNVLFATPQRVARDIVRAMDKGSDVVYVPGFWRYVMLIIRLIPERIFKRLGL